MIEKPLLIVKGISAASFLAVFAGQAWQEAQHVMREGYVTPGALLQVVGTSGLLLAIWWLARLLLKEKLETLRVHQIDLTILERKCAELEQKIAVLQEWKRTHEGLPTPRDLPDP